MSVYFQNLGEILFYDPVGDLAYAIDLVFFPSSMPIFKDLLFSQCPTVFVYFINDIKNSYSLFEWSSFSTLSSPYNLYFT